MENSLVVVQRGENKLSTIVSAYLKNFLSVHTQEAYQRDFIDFASFLATNVEPISHPREITKEHIIAYRDHLRERYRPTSINRKMAALSSLFRELKNSNVVEHNPVDGIKRPPSIVKKERLGFTDQEVNRILDFHSAETVQGLNNQAILRFLFFTGCRISEALHVKVDDIEERDGVKVVHIRGKGEKLRIIPLNPKLAKTLQELIERRMKGKGAYLFTRVQRDQNKPMVRHGVQVLLKKTLQKLNLPLSRSLHSSRRTVISNLLENGARIESVAELAGHANVNTTAKYNVRPQSLLDNPILTMKYKE